MKKQDIFTLMQKNPVFFLATMDGNLPRVRGMMLYKADKDGILFHTGKMKDVYRQLIANPNAELCFVDSKSGMQVRVSGTLDVVDDNALKDEIAEDPSRGFVKEWRDSGALEPFYENFIVFKMKDGQAKMWTMEENLAPSQVISLA